MIAESLRRARLRVSGMDCPSCARQIEESLSQTPGVSEAQVQFARGLLAVEFDPRQVTPYELAERVRTLGFEAEPEGEPPAAHAHAGETTAAQRRYLALLLLAAALMGTAFALQRLGAPDPVWQAAYLISIALAGWRVVREAWNALRQRFTTDINFLMTIAVVGAIAIGEWVEAASVVLLFGIAETLEAWSLDRTRHAIEALIELSPPRVTVRRDAREVSVPVESAHVGETMLVHPGERVPLDGVVIRGESSINEAPITGESVPVEKGPGDEIYAGTLNEQGFLEARITRDFSQSAIARVVQLVEEAQARRSPTEQLVDRFAGYYTPAIMLLAALLATIPPFLLGQPFHVWFKTALTLLIIACPCALVISTPVTVVSVLARAARDGTLVRGGTYLERLAQARVVAFDKTGTLTRGEPVVTDIIPLDQMDADQLLALAARLELRSEHALARAILHRARHQGLAVQPPTIFEALAGQGAEALLDSTVYRIGKASLFRPGAIPPEARERALELQRQGKTAVFLGTPDRALGILAIADTTREVARQAVEELRNLGIRRVVMLTGDNPNTARAIAEDLGITDYFAELLPADKVDAVLRLTEEHGNVVMVGDGINDAPALAAASVGVAMGAAGTDVALETADVALMSDDLTRLPLLIRLSRRALATIRFNIGLSLAVKAGFIALVLLWEPHLWLAVVADMGTSLAVIANALRLLQPA
ncbi:MAG: cadmium-translocating P-type ATPase [Armatimonadetes bacterium]|nr:cadmium-translocating P-type ATPase [Armatimonadota bacterium]